MSMWLRLIYRKNYSLVKKRAKTCGIIKVVICMGIIDNVIDSAIDAFRFKDTVFYKDNSDLQDRYDALKKLNEEYPNNVDLMS